MNAAMPRFRAKLAGGQFCLGIGITFSDPAVTEAIGPSVDFVWIDLEHNPISLESLQGHLIAARACQTAALVRVPSCDTALLKRVLDTGAPGIIVPQIVSADEVRQVVAACRYAPEGSRGYGPRRPSNYGRDGGIDYMRRANQELFVVVQIETAAAVNDIDRILDVPGLDSLVIGPNDLAGSLGHVGQVDHPEVVAAIETVIAKSRRAGRFIGMGMAPEIDRALRAARQGVQWLQCGSDFSFLVSFADQIFGRIRGGG
jgi:2-keto-3-deoxy-L-rhamnonate aldolase RhmA